MSAIVCSLSGSPLIHPVISLKTGHIYQQSTIKRHLNTSQTCPHTGQPLHITDLLPLHPNPTQAVTPQVQFSSTEKIISKVQSQYEAMLLEAHYLKNQYKQVRQQLAHALYRQDASIRVIAKLQEQVDANRQEIGKILMESKQIYN